MTYTHERVVERRIDYVAILMICEFVVGGGRIYAEACGNIKIAKDQTHYHHSSTSSNAIRLTPAYSAYPNPRSALSLQLAVRLLLR